MIRQPPISPLFPYTTLFRSDRARHVPERAGATRTRRESRRGNSLTLEARDVDESEHATRDGCECALARSEEHTSELQSQSNLVCRLLIEKKNFSIYSVLWETVLEIILFNDTATADISTLSLHDALPI